MALSFLYLGFGRVLQLLRLQRRDTADLAIEVITRSPYFVDRSAGQPSRRSWSSTT